MSVRNGSRSLVTFWRALCSTGFDHYCRRYIMKILRMSVALAAVAIIGAWTAATSLRAQTTTVSEQQACVSVARLTTVRRDKLMDDTETVAASSRQFGQVGCRGRLRLLAE